jgi:hypothetical protein
MSFLPRRSDRDTILDTLSRLAVSIPETLKAPESDVDTIVFALETLKETAPATTEGQEDGNLSEKDTLLRQLAKQTYHASEALFEAGTIPAETLQLVKEAVANRYVPRADLTAFHREPEDDKATEQ